jgi:putative oxidoreductase
MTTRTTPGKGLNIILWTLQILAAAAFLFTSGLKLTSSAQAVATFEKIGAGQWFRYLTGTLEATGAIGLLIPGLAFYAAALLAVVMVGAVITHLTILGGSPAGAIVLLLITGTVAYLRRPR